MRKSTEQIENKNQQFQSFENPFISFKSSEQLILPQKFNTNKKDLPSIKGQSSQNKIRQQNQFAPKHSNEVLAKENLEAKQNYNYKIKETRKLSEPNEKLISPSNLVLNQLSDETFQQSPMSMSPQISSITPNQKLLVQNPAKKQLRFITSGFMRPDPTTNKNDPDLSSDSMCILENVCGVADGVGQWKRYGINPKMFGQNLLDVGCKYIQNQIQRTKENSFSKFYLESQILENLGKIAFRKSLDNIKDVGSSTITVYYIYSNTLYYSYLGDTQLMVLRPSFDIFNQFQSFYIVQKSKCDQLEFNKPRQLMKWPSSKYIQKMSQQNALELNKLFPSLDTSINPESAKTGKVQVKEKDLILCASDGLFDNIEEDQILRIISQEYQQSKINNQSEIFLRRLCENLVNQACQLSLNEDYDSPFSKKARKSGIQIKKGKPDDCTVVISSIV